MGIVIVLMAAGIIPGWPAGNPSGSAKSCLAAVTVENDTGLLATTFRPGAIQAFGANDSTVLLAGTGVYLQPTDFTLPTLDSLSGGPLNSPATNLTPLIEPYFHHGGVYGPAWNGTAWLLGGQARLNGTTGPALVAWKDGAFTNLTRLVTPFFLNRSESVTADWGIWVVAWNGTAWLLAGTGSRGATLLALQGDVVTDLTPWLSHVAHPAPDERIQFLGWNGTTWILSGYQIFESYSHGTFTNYLPQSSFALSGAYGADWNGTAWLVTGGPPSSVAVLQAGVLRPGPNVTAPFAGAWVGAAVALTPGNWDARCTGWLIAGVGYLPSGLLRPALALWLPEYNRTMFDLSASLPSSFAQGQVEWAGFVPPYSGHTVLLAGQGWYNSTSGTSYGALGVVRLGVPA